jgi:hypothetical protein
MQLLEAHDLSEVPTHAVAQQQLPMHRDLSSGLQQRYRFHVQLVVQFPQSRLVNDNHLSWHSMQTIVMMMMMVMMIYVSFVSMG